MVSSFRSPKSTVRGRRSPFRMISSSTLVPGASPATLRDRAEGVSTRRPSTFAMMSPGFRPARAARSEEHTSELQSRLHLVCRLLLEKKKYALPPADVHNHNELYTRLHFVNNANTSQGVLTTT